MNQLDIARLKDLSEGFRKKADAIALVLDILANDAAERQTTRTRTIIAHAINIDHARNGHPVVPPRIGRPPKQLALPPQKKLPRAAIGHGQIHKTRALTRAFLDLFSTTEPSRPDHPRTKTGISKLLASGYLKRVKDETPDGEPMYLRTTKPYHPEDLQPREGATFRKDPVGRREQMQRFLWKFSKTEPSTHQSRKQNMVALLVRHGYLVKQGEGYLRTDKRFSTEGRD